MTNLGWTIAAAPVAQALASEVDNGRKVWDAVAEWLAKSGTAFLVDVLVAGLLLAVGVPAIRFLTAATQRGLALTGKVNNLLEKFLCRVVNKSAWALLLMVVIQRLGVNVAPLVAGLGITGFIVGFAFQESLGNLAAGMMIAVNQPFQVGDYVSVGGVEGAVRELNMMATTLATADNRKVVVPNKVIWGAPITNYTATDKRRFEVGIGIAYGADIGKAKQVALEVLRANPLVMADPPPFAEVLSFGDSAVNLVLRGWAKPADYWAVFFAATQGVKEAFDKNGVEIPFPQMDVHMKG